MHNKMDMIEPNCYYHQPIYQLEILTIDIVHNTLLEAELFNPMNNVYNFPMNCIGRIYSDNGVGTGFVYKSASGKII